MGTYASFILCLVPCFITFYSGVCSISTNNGAYEDINIVIQESVPEDQALLQRIQIIFTDASQLLFNATKHHVYFGKINIILPKTWSNKSEYDVIAARSELDSYITVEESSKKRPPHTKSKGNKCGEQGHYIYLPTEFLLTEGKTEWGYHATVLVLAWARYRWGLYDEYITKKNERFYMDGGEWKQSRCSEQIKGEVGMGNKCYNGKKSCDTSDTTKKIDKNCKFCPDEYQNDGSGSIMAYNWVDGVTMFCDDPDDDSVPIHQKHNKKARNKQNLKCNHRSAWEVMRHHDDFKSAAPLPASTNTTPEFQIQQEGFCYRVFVLDVSGSMAGPRIGTLYRTSKYIIETLLADGSYLGIVWFDTNAQIKKPLTQITSDAVRKDLVGYLPNSTFYSTCIGCGIDAALSMQAPGYQAGLEIILISDGQNNEGDLDASIQNAVDAQVTIHTIAVSQAADTRLESMATRTGGIHVSYLEGEYVSLADTFLKVLPCGMTSYASELIPVLSEKLNTSPLDEASVTFDIDSSIGNNTAVRVLLDKSADIDLEVSGPDGAVNTKQANGQSVVLVLPGTAVAGQYNAKVKSSSQANLEFYVTSLPNDPEVVRVSSQVTPATLDFNGELPVIIADVMKGRAPVIGANVTAVVESGSSSCNVALLDNGAVPDDFADDGVYSAVIPRECLRNGRLSTKIYVRGENGTAHVLYDLTGAGSSDSDEDSNNTEVLQSSFQRVTVSNEIYLTNVFMDQDIVAPGRITDVDIVDIVTENTQYGESRNFTITWTATGDDVNVGQAMEYELRISDDLTLLSNNFSSAELLDVVNANFTPKAAGETEAIRLEVDAEESYVSTAYFAVRAKDGAGNVGPVSNIVSIVVADGYRIQVEADVTVVYSDTTESVEESSIEEEKVKNLIGLAVGLSSAAAFIVIAIIVVTCCVKKLKAKEIVEDCEFNSRTSITTVTSVDNKLLEFLAADAVRETVAKKTFLSSQLQTIPEKEQAWAQSFISRPTSAITFPRKPFDIISQGECSIEMLLDNNDISSEKFDEYLDNDTHSLSRESHCSSSEFTRKSETPNTPDFFPNSPSNAAPTGSSENEADRRHISERRETECETKNKSKQGFMSEIFEEQPLTYRSLELPVLNDDELHNEIKKYYDGVF